MQKLFIAIGAILVILIGGLYFLPSSHSFDERQQINAPAHEVFKQLNDLREFSGWFQFQAPHKTVRWQPGSKISGAGASADWKDKSFNGTLKILQSDAFEKISHKFDGDYKAEAKWTIEKKDANLTVVNLEMVHHGNGSLLGKVKSWMGKQQTEAWIQANVQRLRSQAERRQGSAQRAIEQSGDLGDLKVQEIQFPGKSYIQARKSLTMREMNGHFANYFPLIYGQAPAHGTLVNGFPCAFFYDWNDKEGIVDVAAALPVDSALDISDDMKGIVLPPAPAIQVVFKGPPEQISKAHLLIDQYLSERNLQLIPPTIEEYTTDATSNPDPEDQVTNVIAFYKEK